MSKILYLFEASDWLSRIPVAHEAQEQGHSVVLGLIGDHSGHDTGDFVHHFLGKHPKVSEVFAPLDMIFEMHKLIRHEKPDIVHTVTLKYAFFCALAALGNPKMRKIYTLAGLGYLFHGHDKKSHVLRFFLKPLLSFLFKRPNTTLVFQNPDDLKTLVKQGYANQKQCVLIRGSGVNLGRFSPGTRPQENPPIVLMPTRLVHEKGISVFIEAAKILHGKDVDALFQIAGGETKHNPKAISRSEMLTMLDGSPVEWLGRVEDMPALLEKASLIVYPSYYGEGIPRVLLEACAAGRTIVTTNHTGCREAVEHGVNGLLVPVRDAPATARAIEDLLCSPEKCQSMGHQSRIKAEEEFDIRIIAKHTAALYA